MPPHSVRFSCASQGVKKQVGRAQTLVLKMFQQKYSVAELQVGVIRPDNSAYSRVQCFGRGE